MREQCLKLSSIIFFRSWSRFYDSLRWSWDWMPIACSVTVNYVWHPRGSAKTLCRAEITPTIPLKQLELGELTSIRKVYDPGCFTFARVSPLSVKLVYKKANTVQLTFACFSNSYVVDN